MISKATMKRALFYSAPALLGCAVLAAQAPPGGGGQQPSMPQQQQPQQPTAGTTATPGAGPTAQNFGDQAFVSKALEGGAAEVQLGQLAQEKSQSNDVKQFGQKMVSEHQQMADKWFKPVAQQIGANEPKEPSKKDRKLIEKLQGLSGQQFDAAYIQAMVKDHRQDLKDFQSEAKSAQDPNVKQVAEQGAGIISKHLQLIEQIATAHNVPIDGGGKQMSSK